MSEIEQLEQNIEDFKRDLIALVEKFEKENGMLLVNVKYDGFDKSVNYAITDANARFVRINEI